MRHFRHRKPDNSTALQYDQIFANRTNFSMGINVERSMSTFQQRLNRFRARMHQEKMTMLDPDDLNPADMTFERDRTLLTSSTNFMEDLFGRKERGSNFTGLVVLCIVLTAIIVIFFGCYLMMRFMHRALSRDDSKDPIRPANQYNNVVMHSKRVYEIQAEEGCFGGAPDPLDEDEQQETEESEQKIEENESQQQKVKKPECGDLRSIRNETQIDDDPRAMLRKKQKVHKDSVCAFLFRPQPEPKMV